MTTLAERMILAIAEKGCSNSDLASAAGVRPPSVTDWTNGKTLHLKAATGHRAAAFLGVNFLWLTEGRGPMRPGADAKGRTLDIESSAAPPSLKETLERLAEALAKAPQSKRDAVGQLLILYARDPQSESGSSIAQTIELLLRPDANSTAQ